MSVESAMSFWESRVASRSTKAARIEACRCPARAAWAHRTAVHGTAVHGIDHRLSHLARIALHIERTGRKGTAHLAGRRIFVDVHRRRTHQATTKARFGGAGLDDRELNVERRDFSSSYLGAARIGWRD
jgi:hypothetical protein